MPAGALSGEHVFTDLFDAQNEFDVGHIRLAREADLIVVAPATADLMANMAGRPRRRSRQRGAARDRPPSAARAGDESAHVGGIKRRSAILQTRARRRRVIGPDEGEMAEAASAGVGRMAEPIEIADAARSCSAAAPQLLEGKRVLVTSGPTHEPIDPVRYIANRSSGKQGHAIAAAAAAAGAEVTLVSGPVTLPDPPGVEVVQVETAREMLDAVERALPADVAIFAAAVADWRVANAGEQKIKKGPAARTPEFRTRGKSRHSRDRRAPQDAAGRGSSSALRPRPRTSSPMPRRSSSAKAATGSSPTTSRRRPASWAAIAIRSISSARRASKRWPPQSKESVARMLIERIAEELQENER